MAKTQLGTEIVLAKRLEKDAHRLSSMVELREKRIIIDNRMDQLVQMRNLAYANMRKAWKKVEEKLWS